MTQEETEELAMTRLLQLGVRLAECTGTDHPHLEETRNTLALAEASRRIRELCARSAGEVQHALGCAELAKDALTAAAQTLDREQAEEAAAAAERAAGMAEQAAHRTAGDAGNAERMERDLREAAGKLPDRIGGEHDVDPGDRSPDEGRRTEERAVPSRRPQTWRGRPQDSHGRRRRRLGRRLGKRERDRRGAGGEPHGQRQAGAPGPAPPMCGD